jgi:hypothetical protein
MLKIKVHEQVDATGNRQIQRNDSVGKLDRDIVTEDFLNNPWKYELTEGFGGAHTGRNDCKCQKCVRAESNHFAASLTSADKQWQLELRESRGWVKVKDVTGFREASGSPERKRLGTVAGLEQRGFTKSAEGKWSRGKVTVVVNDDGSWKCGADSGKDAHTCFGFVDLNHPQPQESFRERLTEAFRLTGMSEREAMIASHENELVMVDAWDIVMGGREAGKLAREAKPRVDPREAELLRQLKGFGR